MEAKFITLEGIEGSGKTSSIKSITNVLDNKNISYIVTREPGSSSIGRELRSILLDTKTEISSEVELMLMLADRKDHVEKVVLPNLTLLFDVPVEISLSRVKARGELDRFEQEEIDFHNRIREAYLELAEQNVNRIQIIDSSQAFKDMLKSVEEKIKNLFFNE